MAKHRRKRRPPPDRRNERLRLTTAEPEADDEDRAAILAQLPAWARLLRRRSGVAVGVAMVGGIVAFSALGGVAGPAISGALLIGTGLALWRADVLERRVRRKEA